MNRMKFFLSFSFLLAGFAQAMQDGRNMALQRGRKLMGVRFERCLTSSVNGQKREFDERADREVECFLINEQRLANEKRKEGEKVAEKMRKEMILRQQRRAQIHRKRAQMHREGEIWQSLRWWQKSMIIFLNKEKFFDKYEKLNFTKDEV